MQNEPQHVHISAKHDLLDLKLKEVWQYRDLIFLFTRRAFAVSYKQTILGPLWLLLSPLMTGIMYVVLFGNIAKLSTDGLPQMLFYLSGNAVWGYFASCVTNNASTFTGNAHLFGKVYFPRLVIPLSRVLSGCIRFGIQMLLVLVLLFYYTALGSVHPHWSAWPVIPLILLQLGIMGMGIGIIISSMTTKYRDLSVLVGFGVQLWMYATPVVYPLSTVGEPLRSLIRLNPVTAPIELFRFVVLGVGTVEVMPLLVSLFITIAAALVGIIVFNQVERNFLDTV